jgi:DNA-binding NtrC family response regulator
MAMDDAIRLLIVDDEAPFLDALRERLELREFVVTTAPGGREALDLCRTGKFDVALIDLKMPGMDGRELLVQLKRAGVDLEVVILTGHGSLDSAVDCTKLGAFSYLPKPVELDKLLAILHQAYAERLRLRLETQQDLQRQHLEDILAAAQGESPLGLLRRMRRLDRGEPGDEA